MDRIIKIADRRMDTAPFSPGFPEMTDEDWRALERSHREESRRRDQEWQKLFREMKDQEDADLQEFRERERRLMQRTRRELGLTAVQTSTKKPIVTSNVTVNPAFVTIIIYFDDIEEMDRNLYAKYLRQAKVIVDDLVKSSYRLLDDNGFIGVWQKTQVNEAARMVTAGYVFETRLPGNQLGRVSVLMNTVRNTLTQKIARMRSEVEHQVMASEILRVARVLVASTLDGMTKQRAARKVNEVLSRHTKGFFRDEDWSNVKRVWDALAAEGIDYTITNTFYDKDQNTQVPTSKTWRFEIEFQNDRGRPMKLYGVLTAAGAGSVQDPLERYDIVAYVN